MLTFFQNLKTLTYFRLSNISKSTNGGTIFPKLNLACFVSYLKIIITF